MSLTETTDVDVTFTWVTSNGTAVGGVGSGDFETVIAPSSATIDAGNLSPTIPIQVTVYGDVDVEATEFFFVVISAITNANSGDQSGDVTIYDDDTTPQIFIDDASWLEPAADGSSQFVNFTVRLDQPSNSLVTFDWNTVELAGEADGDDVDPFLGIGLDFDMASGVGAPINPLITQTTIAVNIKGDNIHELNETFRVDLSGVNGAVAGDLTAIGTILDEDLPTPSGLAATAFSDSRVDLTWAAVSGATSYDIYRTLDTASWSAEPIATSTGASYTDTTAPEGQINYYRVVAVNAATESPPSSDTSVLTAAAPPTSVVTTRFANAQATIDWTDQSQFETGFVIQLSPAGAGSWTEIGTVGADVTSFSGTGAYDSEVSYDFRVGATNSTFPAANASYAVGDIGTLILAPKGLTAAPASDTQIDLAWNSVVNAAGYRIERQVSSAWQFVADVDSSQTSYTVGGLAPGGGISYSFRVASVNDNGDLAYSSPAAGHTVIEAPTNAAAVAVSGTQIDITWTDNSSTETAFEIQQLIAGTWTPIGTASANALIFPAPGPFAPLTAYSFRVRATNTIGTSDFSGLALATTGNFPTAPTGLTVTEFSTAQLTFEWNDNSNEDGYRVYRKEQGGPTWTPIGSTAANVTTFSDTTILVGPTYLYSVRAFNAVGESAGAETAPISLVDIDDDMLSDAEEAAIGTDPFDFDTDGDLLSDGFEYNSNGALNPLDGTDDPHADADGDGLSNLDEQIYGTNAGLSDTDGDGVSDSVEVGQGSDPNDPSDMGQPPEDDSIVNVRLLVGDFSGSNSERYDLVVGPIRHQAPVFGEVEAADYLFQKGESHQMEIIHRGTNLSSPDYDYSADVSLAAGETDLIIVEDLDDILRLGWYAGDDPEIGGPFYPYGKLPAYLHIPEVDLDFVDAGGVPLVDEEERNPGGFLLFNDDDDDGDGVVDFMDDDVSDTETGYDDDLAELVLRPLIPTSLQGLPGAFTLNFPASKVRVWEDRQKIEEVISDSTAFSLDAEETLYVEGIAPSVSLADVDITAIYTPGSLGSGFQVYGTDASDIVSVTVFKADLDAALISHNTAAGFLADGEEAHVDGGAYLPVNNDDDDYDASNLADHTQTGAIAGENDLLPIHLAKVSPLTAGTEYHLDIPSHVRIWKNANRTDEVILSTLLDATQDWDLYVEGISEGTGLIRLDWSTSTVTRVGVDKIRVTTFTWQGALNVPGYAKYNYTATNGRVSDGKWLTPVSGTNRGAIDSGSTGAPDEMDIQWDSGPVVGKAVYQPRSGYIWDLDVNVVEVKIEAGASNFVTINSDPVQVNGAWSTKIRARANILASAVNSGLAVQDIQGPMVGGSPRGEKFIEMGLVHQARLDARNGEFNGLMPPKKRVSSLQDGLVHWDAGVMATIPWTYMDGNHYLDVTGDGTAITRHPFLTEDNPDFNASDLTVLQGDPIDRLNIKMKHWQYFAVRAMGPDINGSRDVLTIRGEFEWDWDGTGDIDAAGVWMLTGSGVTSADTKYNEVTDGSRVPDAAANLNEASITATWATM